MLHIWQVAKYLQNDQRQHISFASPTISTLEVKYVLLTAKALTNFFWLSFGTQSTCLRLGKDNGHG